MADKILCGGFKIDGTSLVEENGILKATATGLPDASEATNGQGLIVDDGKFVIGDLPQGGGGSGGNSGIIIVNATVSQDMTTVTLDKTWQEIHDAGAGFVKMDAGAMGGTGLVSMPITAITNGETSGGYAVYVMYNMDPANVELTGIKFSADSASDYPKSVQPGGNEP